MFQISCLRQFSMPSLRSYFDEKMTQLFLKALLENCVLSLKVHTIARTIDIFINVGHKVMPS